MIVLQPIGTIDQSILQTLKESLSRAFNRRVEIGNGTALTEESWDQQRGQYQAGILLEALPSSSVAEDRVLGLVDADVYAPQMNFVLGQADISRRRAIIALCRLRQEFYGLTRDDKLFQERVLKEAVHELGHTYGLRHCPHQRCVMYFSNSLYDTDTKEWQFCTDCGRELMQ